MSFEIRSGLLRMVGNSPEAYSTAFGFVQDNPDKLSIFNQAWVECKIDGMEARSAAATEMATARWLIMYPEQQ